MVDGFPSGSFARVDESDDAAFCGPSRLVTHIAWHEPAPTSPRHIGGQ
jgi:hypothetical protein